MTVCQRRRSPRSEQFSLARRSLAVFASPPGAHRAACRRQPNRPNRRAVRSPAKHRNRRIPFCPLPPWRTAGLAAWLFRSSGQETSPCPAEFGWAATVRERLVRSAHSGHPGCTAPPRLHPMPRRNCGANRIIRRGRADDSSSRLRSDRPAFGNRDRPSVWPRRACRH